ncbi:MAG TPA: DUF4192 domain-containing protein [Candidatus Nanopelagicaceae bacterium]
MTTLTSPHDLLAAIPFLIGYHPTDSLVLISLKDEAVGMAMRVDYPPLADATSPFDAYEALVFHLVREGAEGALMVAYVPDDRTDGEEILGNLAAALTKSDIEVRESLLIFKGQWRSLLCDDVDCCPVQGRPLPEISSSRIAVEQVAQGRPMPFADVTGLADSISPLPLASDPDFQKNVAEHAVDSEAPNIQDIQREGAVAVIDLASRFIAGSIGQEILADQALSARVLGRLRDIQVRDFALGSHNDDTLHVYGAMWLYLLRIAPKGFIAPVASLLAALAYERGDGALAHRCLDRAVEDDPAYSLAGLLCRVFSAGWPPESFAAMRKDLHPKVCAAIFDR